MSGAWAIRSREAAVRRERQPQTRCSPVRGISQQRPLRDIGLRAADDLRIWNHAKTHGFVVVSKDSDFRERSYVEGFPPKVVWLDVGTAGTSAIADLLKRDKLRLARFENDSEASVLILSIAQSAL